MNSCPLSLFDKTAHTSDIQFDKTSFDNISELCDYVISQLQKQQSFLITNDNYTEDYKKSINDLVQTVIKKIEAHIVSGKIKTDFEFKGSGKRLIRNAIIKLALPTQLTPVEQTIKEQLSDIDVITEQRRKQTRYKDVINKIFGSRFGALNSRRQKLFEQKMTLCTIIDRSNYRLITSVEEMNEAIIEYQSELYSTMYEYLQSVGYNLSDYNIPENMFQKDNTPSDGYQNIFTFMYNIIHKHENDKTLRNDVENGFAQNIVGNESKNNFYLAVNAYVSLAYFDDSLRESFSRYISIDRKCNAPIVKTEDENGDPKTKYKYGFSSGNSFAINTWTNQERDALSELSSFSRVLISQIPVYSFNVNNGNFVTHQRMMTQVEFMNTVTKLIDLSSDIVNDKEIENALLDITTKPRESFKKVLDLLFKENDLAQLKTLQKKKNSKFNQNDINYLYSIYKTLFLDNDSWDNIEQEHIKTNSTPTTYPIIDTILGVVISSVQNDFVESTVEVDTNGDRTTRTKIKPKYSNRNTVFDTEGRINRLAVTGISQSTLDKYKLSYNKGNKKHSITLETSSGDFVINITGSTKNDILQKKQTTPSGLSVSNFPTISETEFETLEQRNKLIARENLSEQQEQIMSIVTFIDDMLETNFSKSTDGLLRLYLMLNASKNNLKEMFLSAARVLVIQNMYNDMLNETKQDGTKYVRNEITQYLKDKTPYYVEIDQTAKDGPNYFKRYETGVYLKAVDTQQKWLDDLSDTDAILSESTSISQTSNFDNKKIPNYSPTYLGSRVRQQAHKSQIARGATKSLIFVQDPGMIKVEGIDTEIQTPNGQHKNTNDCSMKELLYNSLVYKFVCPLLESSDATLYFQPTVASDKPRIPLYGVSFDDIKRKLDINGIADRTLDNKVEQGIRDTVGQMYKNVKKQVIEDFGKILILHNPTTQSIEKELNSLTEEELLQKVQNYNKRNNTNFVLYRETHYKVIEINKKKVCTLNPLLLAYSDYIYDRDLHDIINEEKIKFVNLAMQNLFNIRFDSRYESSSYNSFYKLMKKQFSYSANKWVSGKYIILAKAKNKKTGIVRDVKFGNVDPETEEVELNPVINAWFMISMYVNTNLRYTITGSEINHPTKATKMPNQAAIKEYKDLVAKLNPDYKKTYKMSFAHIYNALQNYNSMSQEDKNKYNSYDIEKIRQLYISEIRSEESAAQNAQLKRNAIITGNMRTFLPLSITGIAPKMKVAVFDDARADVFNFNGQQDQIEAHNGSALVSPIQSILENKALQSDEGGEIKKPILHWYDDRYGTCTFFKFATFTLTNQLMRQSEGNASNNGNGGISLLNLFKRTHSQRWSRSGLNIDLINGCQYRDSDQNRIDFTNDILNGNELFYQGTDNRYKIVDFGIENGIYYTVEQKASDKIGKQFRVYHYFDNNSSHTGSRNLLSEEEIRNKGLHTIDSLYELHYAMGGIYSMSMDNEGRLYYSEASNFATTNFVNMVAYKVDQNQTNEVSIDQTNYNQPLKNAFIGMSINVSALKQGAGNVNKAQSFYDNSELMYIEVDTSTYGKQQESEHESDRSESAEPTQVITALSKGGYLQDDVKMLYQGIGELIIQQSGVEIDAVEQFRSSNNKNELYNIVGRTIIDNYNLGTGSSGLTEKIVDKINKKFNLNIDHEFDELKIPLSDPNLYSKFLPSVISVINRKAIKRKYSGTCAFLAPSYDMVMVYDIDGKIYQFEDLLRIAKRKKIVSKETDTYAHNRDIVKQYLRQLQENQPTLTIDQINPTDNIVIRYKELKEGVSGSTTTTNKEAHIRLDSISDYYDFKENPNEFIKKKYNTNAQIQIIDYKKDIMTPRNLAPTKVLFDYTDKDGKTHHMNIYDHWRIKDFFNQVKEITSNELISNRTKKEKLKEANKVYDPNQAFIELSEGKYIEEDGTEYKVFNVVNIKAELIVSNVYASQFKLSSHDSLIDALNHGKINFKIDIPKFSAFEYDVAFIGQNNQHSYITFQQLENNNESTKSSYISWKKTIRRAVPGRDGEVSIVALNSDNVQLFEVGREILVNNVRYNKKIKKFTDLNDKILDDQDKYRLTKDGRVLEYVEFISRYRITETMVGKTNKRYTNYIIYTINTENIDRVIGENSANLAYQRNSIITDILTKMYQCSNYNGITVNDKLSKESYSIMKYCMSTLAGNFGYNQNLQEHLNRICDQLDAAKENKETGEFELDLGQLKKLNIKYNELVANEKYASLQASLDFIASRIPAQTLQSFMSMKCVGFSGKSNAIAYVSHWQMWIQGSDFDIDKSFLLGCSLTDNGVYVGWSSLFDTSSIEGIRASQTLPLPRGWVFTKSNSVNAVNIDSYINEIAGAATNEEKIKGYSKLLKYLYLNNIKEITFSHPSGNEVLYKLNKHESTKLSNDQISAAYKNYIQTNMNKISQDLLYLFDGHIPVEMNDIRDEANNTYGGQQELRNSMLNPITTFFMERVNMEGKGVVGICANAAKASFMWHYYINDVIRNGNDKQREMAEFTFKSSRIHGRKIGQPKDIIIETLPDINTKNIKKPWDKKRLNPLNPVDNTLSQMITAATDNAKELVLSKINAGEKLSKMSLFLITMGFDVNDIVAFMTSPVARFINIITESDICNDLNISMNETIMLAEGGEIDDEYIMDQIKNLRETLFEGMSEQDIMDDIDEFRNVFDAANEFSTFGQILKLNQGLPQTKQELQKYINKFTNALKKSLGRAAEIDSELQNLVNGFDFLRFLVDESYKQQIKEAYNKNKICINIFDVIDTIPHYKSSLRVLAVEMIADSALSIKSRIYDEIDKKVSGEYGYISDKFKERMLSTIDQTFIKIFLSQFGIKIPHTKGSVTLNADRTTRKAAEDGFIYLNTPENIATFKYMFEQEIIPTLKRDGTIKGYDLQGNLIDIQIEDYKDNAFLQGLMKDFDQNRPIYKLDIDMMATDRGINKLKFLQYLNGLQRLSNVYIDPERKTSVADLFFIYNLITNKNRYGKMALTKVFDILINEDTKQTVVQDYIEFIGNLDYNGTVSFDDNWIYVRYDDKEEKILINDILISSAATVASFYNQSDPMVFMNTDDGRILFVKTGKTYKEMDLLPKIGDESAQQQTERVLMDFQYFTLGGVYAFQVQLDAERAEKLDVTLIRDLQGDGLVTIQKICK